eukprot:3291295-Rhodomonas_salina.1
MLSARRPEAWSALLRESESCALVADTPAPSRTASCSYSSDRLAAPAANLSPHALEKLHSSVFALSRIGRAVSRCHGSAAMPEALGLARSQRKLPPSPAPCTVTRAADTSTAAGSTPVSAARNVKVVGAAAECRRTSSTA